ncbi:hypothetical protein L596_024028 [Steinernema carpocapsae]|uniref:Major sperm protein n=1 Tax=Steinernema carpocapsae TaxID=34508 RepID=A0A4U5MFI2_STECR|nr:hypothetical protein L596_024028 [Steinernema carpocapsae]
MTTPAAQQPLVNRAQSPGSAARYRGNPNEPSLSIDPESATFLTSGGRSEHMLVNCSEARIAVKVRCSDNSVYRVNPVYTFVEPGQCTSLIVTRLPGLPKVDKLVIHYIACSEKDHTAKDLFKSSTTPEVLKLPLSCCNPEDVPSVRGSLPSIPPTTAHSTG